jgi:peptidyl-prolyl cis-trans isomerase A (cyclophilin A)
MRSRITTLALLALVGGCKKQEDPKPKTADQIDPAKNPWNADKLAAGDAGVDAAVAVGSGSAGSAAVALPPPPTGGDEVRPPTAADLAEYTKGLPGKGTKLLATIETNKGTFNCELYGDKTPMTVANFIGLATGKKPWKEPKSGAVQKGKPFYNGLTFHRVMAEFMIQGGDPVGTGTGGPGYQFGDEFLPDLKMEPGVLAMANSGPATNGSQFFITEVAPEWLNGKHTVFGKCKEVDLVKQIARVPQNESNLPNEPVTMKITIKKG